MPVGSVGGVTRAAGKIGQGFNRNRFRLACVNVDGAFSVKCFVDRSAAQKLLLTQSSHMCNALHVAVGRGTNPFSTRGGSMLATV
jgi:hypothetical protein